MRAEIDSSVNALRLDSIWSLEIESNRAYITRRSDRVKVAALSAVEAVALGLMNSRRSTDDLTELMAAISPDEGVRALDQVMSRFAPLLVTAPGASTKPWLNEASNFSLSEFARVLPPDPSLGIRALPGPRVLHWWVTSVCPKRCSYCFADPVHGGKPRDATLPLESLTQIFREAAQLGAKQLLVAGGEPFLRRDLPEVLAAAIGYGIEPGITTKHPISPGLADRLASAGLRHLCLSIDSVRESTNRQMIGAEDYADQICKSARSLSRTGIEFSFECVLTAQNYRDLEGVVSLAADLGARKVLAVPFEEVRSPIGKLSNQDLVLPESFDLKTELVKLGARYPEVELEEFKALAERGGQSPHCDIGITKMLFNAKGQVHRCYKLLSDPSLTGADLRRVSLARAWHDPDFTPIVSPPKQKYSPSECGGCKGFSDCHSTGRCIYQSFVDNKHYFSIDRVCNGPVRTGSL